MWPLSYTFGEMAGSTYCRRSRQIVHARTTFEPQPCTMAYVIISSPIRSDARGADDVFHSWVRSIEWRPGGRHSIQILGCWQSGALREAGVGVVATQAFANPRHGSVGLTCSERAQHRKRRSKSCLGMIVLLAGLVASGGRTAGVLITITGLAMMVAAAVGAAARAALPAAKSCWTASGQPRTMPSAVPDCLGSGSRIIRNELNSPISPARIGMSRAICRASGLASVLIRMISALVAGG